MSHEHLRGGYKLVLVPVENIRTHSPDGALPAYVTVSQDVLFEVVGDVAPDMRLRMSRRLYEQVEVIGLGHVGSGGQIPGHLRLRVRVPAALGAGQ